MPARSDSHLTRTARRAIALAVAAALLVTSVDGIAPAVSGAAGPSASARPSTGRTPLCTADMLVARFRGWSAGPDLLGEIGVGDRAAVPCFLPPGVLVQLTNAAGGRIIPGAEPARLVGAPFEGTILQPGLGDVAPAAQAMRAGQAVLRFQWANWCRSGRDLRSVLLAYEGGPLVVPVFAPDVQDETACPGSSDSPVVLSFPPTAVDEASSAPSANDLRMELHTPGVVRRGGVVRYDVVVSNGGGENASLPPCPRYAQWVVTESGAVTSSVGVIDCGMRIVVPSRGSVTLPMEMPIPDAAGESYLLTWILVDAPRIWGTARLSTARAERPSGPVVIPPTGLDCDAIACIALTFDDGPGAQTARLLDALRARGAHATFFVLGSQVERWADVVKRMIDEGHEVGDHTYDHADLTRLSAKEIRDEVRRAAEAIHAASGRQPSLMRPPYGATRDDIGADIGLPEILWTVDTRDWADRDSEIVRQRALAGAGSGRIILMHDLYPSTVDAVPAIVDGLTARGYALVTVTQLFAGRSLQAGVRYFAAEGPRSGGEEGR